MIGKWYLTTCIATQERWFVRRNGALLELLRPCGTEQLLLDVETVRELCEPCQRCDQALAHAVWRTWRLLMTPERPSTSVPEPTQHPLRSEVLRSIDATRAA